jgi:hypothetical protein
MTKIQVCILTGVFVVALTVRLGSLPHQPFFCDVPANVAAVESGTMIGNAFPGYAPFHWMIKLLGEVAGSPFAGDVLFSVICGLGAILYCTLFAYERAGFRGALLVVILMGFSPMAIYFSTSGASYATDLLGMSAVLYHGNRALIRRSERDLYLVVFWFAFGCVMRPLSFAFAFPGILFLLWRFRSWKNLLITALILSAGAAIYGSLTFHYYGSAAAIQKSLYAPKDAGLHPMTFSWIAANEVRYALFFVWAMNFYIVLIPLLLWQARRSLNSPLFTYLLLLTVPYACLMLWYIPHAGYICMLLPAFICAPWVAENRLWMESRGLFLASIFIVLSFLQFFVARPIPFKGTPSLVLNTYVLTYTHRGIERGMFGNYQQWLAWMQGKKLDVPARGTDE